jgi:hypothetical protein
MTTQMNQREKTFTTSQVRFQALKATKPEPEMQANRRWPPTRSTLTQLLARRYLSHGEIFVIFAVRLGGRNIAKGSVTNRVRSVNR